MIIEVQYEERAAQLQRTMEDDAGLDISIMLPASQRVKMLSPGRLYRLPTGVRIDVPPGFACRIVSRSSTLIKHNILVYEGLIDAGYQGELEVVCRVLGSNLPIVIHHQRLAQLVFFKVPRITMLTVESFGESVRGVSGFGSSGL